MDAKDFLKQVRRLDILINNKQEEIDRLKSMAQYPKGNTMQDLAVKIIDYENELNKDIDSLIDKRKEVARIIDQLDNADMIDILYKRYFFYEKWELIALDKGYTYQGLHKIHAKALIKIQNLLNC